MFRPDAVRVLRRLSVRARSARRALVLAGTVAAAAAIAACSSTNTGGTPVVSSQTLRIPLTLGTAGENPGPRILVALPSAAPFQLVFDTGSTGLRMLPNALAGVPSSAYTDTGVQTSNEFGGDRVYYGTVGVANPGVVLGGIAVIGKPLPFQIVRTVCSGNVPSPLPTSVPSGCLDTTSTEEQENAGGFFGVRPNAFTSGIVSPMAELPPPYGNGFTVSAYGNSPSVTVGTTASNSVGFGLFTVATATAADGSAYWASNELFPWCYTISVPGGGSTPQVCPTGGVLTDSGGTNERLNLVASPPPGVAPQTIETLPPASTITATLTQPGAVAPAITWTLTTGRCTYFNAPVLFFSGAGAPSPTLKTTNALEPFFGNDILYDLAGGAFGFRPVTPVPPSYCG